MKKDATMCYKFGGIRVYICDDCDKDSPKGLKKWKPEVCATVSTEASQVQNKMSQANECEWGTTYSVEFTPNNKILYKFDAPFIYNADDITKKLQNKWGNRMIRWRAFCAGERVEQLLVWFDDRV